MDEAETNEFEIKRKKRLGELVTDAYKSLGLTRQQLALQVGVSERTLYVIANGTSVPRAQTRRKLEEALGWRKDAINDFFGLGPGVYLDQITLQHMRPAEGEGWGPWEPSEENPLQRLQDLTVDIAMLLRDKDREIEKLRKEVELLRGH